MSVGLVVGPFVGLICILLFDIYRFSHMLFESLFGLGFLACWEPPMLILFRVLELFACWEQPVHIVLGRSCLLIGNHLCILLVVVCIFIVNYPCGVWFGVVGLLGTTRACLY